MNKGNITPATIARTVILALALINQVLTVSGKSIIPIGDETIELFISTGFTIATSIVAWWKNNSFTPAAIAADNVMHDLKNNDLHSGLDVNDGGDI